MARSSSVELLRYRGLRDYKPEIGDVVIKHGWFSRTKWFGVVRGVDDGSIDIIMEGTPLLLVTVHPSKFSDKSKVVGLSAIVNGFRGSYSVVKYDSENNMVVWYV